MMRSLASRPGIDAIAFLRLCGMDQTLVAEYSRWRPASRGRETASDRSECVLACFVAAGFGLIRIWRALVVFVGQCRRADFLLFALHADDVNQIGTAQAKLLCFAQLVQLAQMRANHVSSPGRVAVVRPTFRASAWDSTESLIWRVSSLRRNRCLDRRVLRVWLGRRDAVATITGHHSGQHSHQLRPRLFDRRNGLF